MRGFSKRLLSLSSATVLALLATTPAWASCTGAGCGCSAISVPSWTPPAASTAESAAYSAPTESPRGMHPQNLT